MVSGCFNSQNGVRKSWHILLVSGNNYNLSLVLRGNSESLRMFN